MSIENEDYIVCQICHKQFGQIAGKHLAKHNTTFESYKLAYPNAVLICRKSLEEKSRKISESRKGKPAHNKGKVMSEEQKAKLSASASDRYANGFIHSRTGAVLTDETKRKISQSLVGKSYWTDEINAKRNETIAAKVENGWVSPLKGRELSEYHKAKVTAHLQLAADTKSARSLNLLIAKCAANKLEILNTDYTDFKLKTFKMNLKCTECDTKFSFIKGMFSDSSKAFEKWCPTCYPRISGYSASEKEVANYVKSLGIFVVENDRSVLLGKEIDIFLPDKGIGIEYCGLYWHADLTFAGHNNHLLHKQQFAYNQNITLFTIFEDEWKFKSDIVKSRLAHILGVAPTRFHARKCVISTVNSSDKNAFLNDNHIQGTDSAGTSYGAYYNDELVAVMTFKRTSFVKGGDGSQIELSRFACKLNISIPGIASRLLKRFIRDTDTTSLISYADRRWSTGNLYKTLGFKFDSTTPPSYWYMQDYTTRVHRSNFMKHKLLEKYNADESMTEWEIMQSMGYDRIWDCGNTKWVLNLT